MSMLANVCSGCRTINSQERKICGICGQDLTILYDSSKEEEKILTMEELIDTVERPLEMTILIILNYIGVGILFIMLDSQPLHSMVTWIALPLTFIGLFVLLFLVQIGTNSARIVFILLGVLIIIGLIYQSNYIFTLPVIADIGILAFDPRISNYCKDQ